MTGFRSGYVCEQDAYTTKGKWWQTDLCGGVYFYFRGFGISSLV
jgi:hypothetical protein